MACLDTFRNTAKYGEINACSDCSCFMRAMTIPNTFSESGTVSVRRESKHVVVPAGTVVVEYRSSRV